jgi:hypothetical protein
MAASGDAPAPTGSTTGLCMGGGVYVSKAFWLGVEKSAELVQAFKAAHAQACEGQFTPGKWVLL